MSVQFEDGTQMTIRMTRRYVFGMLTGAGVTMATSQRLVQVVMGQSGEIARLGDGRDAFDSVFGEGLDTNTGLIQYGFTNDDEIVYFVRFNDDVADHIEIDLTSLPGGGLSDAYANAGESRFIPDDAEQITTFRAGNLQFETSGFDLASWSSSSMANATGRSGKMLVIDLHNVPGDGASATTTYERAIVSMEGNDVFEVIPSGSGAILTAPLDAWWEEYGQAPSSQRASHVANPPLEKMNLGISLTSSVVAEIDILLDEGIPIEDAIEFVGRFLPSDAMLEQTHYGVPSPTGPIGLRTNIWTLPSSGSQAMSLLYVAGGEEAGNVTRILMALDSNAAS